jgi:endonuclease III
LAAGWDRLVEVLDAGGYVRYDFSTASTLLQAMDKLLNTYNSLEELYAWATDSLDHENKLQQLKGVGPVAVNILLREFRSVWPKASPRPSPLSSAVAQKLGIAASALQVPDIESALVRIHLDFCKRQKCAECPFKEGCFQPVSTQ